MKKNGMRIILALSFFLTATSGASQQRHSDGLDDVLQHVPMASVLVLKATGVHSQANWTELAFTALGSYAMSAAVTYSLKHIASERRPDDSDKKSFPSGHATFAFAGATVLHHEFGHLSPWVTVSGYGLATFVAVRRVALDRHYLHDVCAGAAIGVAATELSYFIKKKLLKSDNVSLSFTGSTVELALSL